MNRIEKSRKETGMTQEEVAKKAGIARTSYTNIENGERRPSVDVAKRIAAVLEIDWTIFFEKEEQKTA